ncbi:MAG: hypothetical protein HDT04_00810 [Bacteroidales bacterium]|nr:hypothetical protein [Bacteroidales bacterium]
MKLNRSIVIPAVLIVYLGIMSYIGYPSYSSGTMSATYYFGVIGATLFVIFLLHLNLKKRERLRREREADK